MLAIIGFGMDFDNAWSNNNSSGSGSSAYVVILPACFIGLAGWIIYFLSKRKSVRRTEKQEIKIRQQIYAEQGLASDTRSIIITMLTRNNGMTSAELSQALSMNQDETVAVIKELLQSGSIRQDATQRPVRFYAIDIQG